MANNLSSEVKAQLFKQESEDPYLTLVTLTGTDFIYRLVNNSKDIVSNGQTFTAFPMKIKLPVDDGETAREFSVEFDNASLLLIQAIRKSTEPIPCKFDMVLASMPDVIQMTTPDLKIAAITYDDNKISAKIVLDNFLTVALTSEKYTPAIYKGIF